MSVLTYLALLAGGYLLGSIPLGLILARAKKGIDIRQVGSSNIGATNVLRVLGKKAALITLLGDMLKGGLPVYIGIRLEITDPALALLAITPVLGHIFPLFAGFRGGKGVATGIGMLAALMPGVALWVLLVWLAVLLPWRYVSLSSVVAAFSVPFVAGFKGEPRDFVLLGAVAAALIIFRHRHNISRLIAGTENRLGSGSHLPHHAAR